MKKQLFFDDNLLFGIENVERKYGEPKIISTYNDGISSTDFCTGYVFRLDNGKFRMLYFGASKSFNGKKFFSAISEDGVNFEPEQIFDLTEHPDKEFSHEIMSISGVSEVATVFEDEYCTDKNERYKLLMTEQQVGEYSISDVVYVSSDLISWTKKEGSFWADGAEPIAGAFYNKRKRCYTVVERPFWGVRVVGYKETLDWVNFSEFRYCVNVDALDGRLDEIYGMTAFEYEGNYVGLVHLYRGLESEYNAKYCNGIIDTQIAYSSDGRFWTRSLREPFISGVNSKEGETEYKITWITSLRKGDDGSIYLYGSASELEHGPAFVNPGTGKILVRRLREDGFIKLVNEDISRPSSIITREKMWRSGELHVNLKAESATVAVYVSEEEKALTSNLIGYAMQIEGMGHQDCIAFSGDSTDWVPQFESGKKISDYIGKTLVIEIKWQKGELYSLAGDYVDLFNTQGARYRRLGVLPND